VLLQGLADEICLIDARPDKARGESMDLNHAAPFTRPTSIWAGTMDDLADADLIMISAGVSQKQGQSRLDLLTENARIVGDIAEEAGRLAPGAVYLVTTNPVDVMSYVTMKRSGASPSRILGSGTALDTARLRFLVGSRLGIDPKSVHAFVLGEHGDSELVAWSRAQVAGTGLGDWPDMDEGERQTIEDDVRGAAYQVIRMKGATHYAIGLTLAKITEAVLKDSRTVFSVSTYLQGEYGIYGVYLGAPAIVGSGGVLRTLEIPLSDSELRRLQESGRVVRTATESLDLGRQEITPREKGRRELVGAAAAGFEASLELDVDAPKRPTRARTRKITKRPRPL
jgi:L-lactate dehydrogenase